MPDDFDFLEHIYSGGLAKRADKEGSEALSEPERNILYAWWAKGEIDNGGFALLYAGPVNIDEVCTAFSEIDLLEAAHACLESKAAFQNGHPPEDQKQRLAEVEGRGSVAVCLWQE